MAKTYTARSWVDDLVGGFDAGVKIDEKIDKTAERRKKAKIVGTVDGEMKSKLFNVEDKGWLGNLMYNKFGIGDPPQVSNKAGVAPAAMGAAEAAAVEPTSDARAMAATGVDALKGLQAESATGPVPEPMAEIAVTPVQTVPFAAPAPMVAPPALPPVADGQPLTAYQQALRAASARPRV